jgi:hypothetical protein
MTLAGTPWHLYFVTRVCRRRKISATGSARHSVESVKPTAKRQEIADGYLPNFYLIVQPLPFGTKPNLTSRSPGAAFCCGS